MKRWSYSGTFLLFLLFTLNLSSQEVLQWRGADRSGNYGGSNLLKSWPDGGPNLLWEYDGLGNGYGSPVITSTNIFINGEMDTISYLFALDKTGKFLWKSPIGKEWVINYPGSRSTPTVVNDLIYVSAGLGTVACLESATGKLRWSVDLVKDFRGTIPRFGFSESVLVDGDILFCSPGNADTNVVALDRFTGKIIWISKGVSEITSYTSPVMIQRATKRILVTFSKTTLMGIDSKDGTLLWSYAMDGQDIDCQCNTPYYEQGAIYLVNGNGNGAVKLALSEDGTKITEVFRNSRCDGLFGGFIKMGNYLYTSGYEKRSFYTLDCQNGAIVDSLKFDRGAIISADQMLYLYNEKGQLALAKPTDTKLEIVSSFKLTKGTKAHFAHPVICEGILFVRHGKSLLAYDIKAK